MDAVDFLRTKARMCKEYDTCQVCPARGRCTDHIVSTWNDEEIKKSIAIFKQWAAEHPLMTRWILLKKQYPKIADSDKYEICARTLGYECKDCDHTDCKDCWDMPVDEEEQE